MVEKAIVELLDTLTRTIGELAKIMSENQAWGVVAALLVLLVLQGAFARRDRWRAHDDVKDKDAKVSELLEHRNKQVLEAFDKATTAIQAVRDSGDRLGDLEDRIDALDKRCDARLHAKCKRKEPS